jgi:hypothetical protein
MTNAIYNVIGKLYDWCNAGNSHERISVMNSLVWPHMYAKGGLLLDGFGFTHPRPDQTL